MLDIIYDDLEAQEEASSTVLDVPVVLIGHGLGGTLAMDVAMADSVFYGDEDDEVEPAVDKVVVIDPYLSLGTHIKRSTKLVLSSDSLRSASSSLWPTMTVQISQLNLPGSDQGVSFEDDVLNHDRTTVRLVEEVSLAHVI